jgi:hypothetical protein
MPHSPLTDYEKPMDASKRAPTVLAPEQEKALLTKCAPWLVDVVKWTLHSRMRFGEIVALMRRGTIHVEGRRTGRAQRHPQRTDTPLAFR